MRWPWKRPSEVRETYTNIIETALYDHALGSIGAPMPQETSAVVAACRLWSSAASSFVVTPDDGPLSDELPEIGWRLARYGAYAARLEDGRQLSTVDRFRVLPSGWYAVEWADGDRTVRAVVPPDALLLIELPGKRAPWRSSGATALAALDRALAIDSGKPVGLIVGSGLEGDLDIGAVTQTLASAWKSDYREGSLVVSDGRPVAAHTGPSADLLTGAANLRPDLAGSISDSYGVPRALFVASGVGTREALRSFNAVTGSWIAALIQRAARLTIDSTITVVAKGASTPSDVVSRSRAFASLVAGGVEVDEALRIAGLR